MNRSAWVGLVVGLLIGVGGIVGVEALAGDSDSAVTTTAPAVAETSTTLQDACGSIPLKQLLALQW